MSITAIATVTPTAGRRRRPESPDDLLARYRASGLTQRAFCERVGVPLSTLQWWLARARRQARAARAVTFTEVPLPLAPAASAPSWAVEVVTTTGVTVRLRAPLHPAALRTLLRGGGC